MGDCPAASQSFSERVPVPALRKYVTCAWVQQVGAKAPPYRHRTVPNGSAELVCVVGSVPKVVGPQTRPTEELVAPGTIAVGVRFRPGAASAALAAPASEFLDLQSRRTSCGAASRLPLANGSPQRRPRKRRWRSWSRPSSTVSERRRPRSTGLQSKQHAVYVAPQTMACGRSRALWAFQSDNCGAAANARPVSGRRRCTACSGSSGSLRWPALTPRRARVSPAWPETPATRTSRTCHGSPSVSPAGRLRGCSAMQTTTAATRMITRRRTGPSSRTRSGTHGFSARRALRGVFVQDSPLRATYWSPRGADCRRSDSSARRPRPLLAMNVRRGRSMRDLA
jgi:hypothetical protein